MKRAIENVRACKCNFLANIKPYLGINNWTSISILVFPRYFSSHHIKFSQYTIRCRKCLGDAECAPLNKKHSAEHPFPSSKNIGLKPLKHFQIMKLFQGTYIYKITA